MQHPLDAFSRKPLYEEKESKGEKKYLPKTMASAFFITAVPSLFSSDLGLGDWFTTEVFQLTVAHEHEVERAAENILVFNYQVSPISVAYSNARENLA